MIRLKHVTSRPTVQELDSTNNARSLIIVENSNTLEAGVEPTEIVLGTTKQLPSWWNGN
jgi:hypothetical protein